jgi:hypothetical protein
LLGYGSGLLTATPTGFELATSNLPGEATAMWNLSAGLYALVGGEIYRTSGDLSSFELVSSLPVESTTPGLSPSLLETPSGLVLLVETRAFFSTDGGASWEERSNGLREFSSMRPSYAVVGDRIASQHGLCVYVSRTTGDW